MTTLLIGDQSKFSVYWKGRLEDLRSQRPALKVMNDKYVAEQSAAKVRLEQYLTLLKEQFVNSEILLSYNVSIMDRVLAFLVKPACKSAFEVSVEGPLGAAVVRRYPRSGYEDENFDMVKSLSVQEIVAKDGKFVEHLSKQLKIISIQYEAIDEDDEVYEEFEATVEDKQGATFSVDGVYVPSTRELYVVKL